MKNFVSTYLEILNEQKNFLRFNADLFSIDELNDKLILEQIKNVLNESEDPNYYAKFPKQLLKLTYENQIIDKHDILSLFPEFEKYDFPKIFISFFDFGDKNEVKKFLKSISKINDNKIKNIFKRAFLTSTKRGCFIDLTKFGIDLGFLLFNSKKFNQRTIFHEWTHLFQTYVGNDFKKFIELSNKNKQLKNKKLKKFDLTFDIVQNYFFSDKEYVARLDNLIYMIHQIQKLDKYKDYSDQDFWKLFKKEILKNQFNSELTKDILKIDENFKVDIQFFIAANICFDGELFTKLCFDIGKRL